MAQIFPTWINKLPLAVVVGGGFFSVAAVGGAWYFFSPEYTDVGYQPVQPVAYSHKVHAGDLGIDCRYCHISVENSAVANVPPTSTCMNCHSLALRDSPKLAPVVASSTSKRRMRWVRVHQLPDYAFFNHSAHVNKGVGCVTCHGRVDQMEEVYQVEPLSMSWCLECHRDPAFNLRPLDQVTNMSWQPPRDPEQHRTFAQQAMTERQIQPPEDCSGCHR